MSDKAHDWTDEQLENLCVRMREAYSEAANEMQDNLEKWMSDFDRKNTAWKKAVKDGTKTKADYEYWLEEMSMERTWQEAMIQTLSYDAVNADARAIQMLNDEIPTIYAENANMAAYDICRDAGLDIPFTIYNTDSVRWLIEQDRQLLPEVDVTKDLLWNRQKMTSAVTQAILQGDSIPMAAKRLKSVFDMDNRAAERTARTAITYAESMGRQHSFERAEKMGISLSKQWRAHVDGRTRIEHREADRQMIGVDGYFNVGGYKMRCPGDPTAPGRLVYNCRCYMKGKIDENGIPAAVTRRHYKLPKGVTYEQWKQGTYVTDRYGKETSASKRDRNAE